MNNPLISVILPCYNAEKYLEATIESILAQTYEEFELLAVDDASLDGTGKIIQKYAENDSRIMYFRNEVNLGITKTLIEAIRLSTGKYLARHDAGDLSHFQRFEKQVAYLEKKNLDVLGTRALIIDAEGNEIKRYDFALSYWAVLLRIPFFNSFCHGTLILRKSSYDRVGGYRIAYKYAQDYDLIMRLFMRGFRCENHPEHLYSWRDISTGISNEKRMEQNIFASMAGFPIDAVNRAIQKGKIPMLAEAKRWILERIKADLLLQ